MPNWCGGVIKIRGKRENLKAFLKDILIPTSFWGSRLKYEIEETDYSITFGVKERHKDLYDAYEEVSWYLQGTRSAFIIQNKRIEFGFLRDEEEEQILTIEGFKQAWGIMPKDYLEFSKKHSVDIKIFGYEKGMEFTQEVEIIKGEVTKNKETEYKDYQWEVAFSQLGG